MWVTKLLILPSKKKDFLPKNDQIWPKIGIFGQFGTGHAGLFSALLVGRLVVVARGLYLARHLFTLFGFFLRWESPLVLLCCCVASQCWISLMLNEPLVTIFVSSQALLSVCLFFYQQPVFRWVTWPNAAHLPHQQVNSIKSSPKSPGNIAPSPHFRWSGLIWLMLRQWGARRLKYPPICQTTTRSCLN